MQFTPKQYQKRATQFLIDNHKALLFADMGLGKTVMVLNALQWLSFIEPLKILVIAPKRVADLVWRQEIDKWSHLNFSALRLQSKKDIDKAIDYDINIINIENIFPYIVPLSEHTNVLVADEIHGFGNPTSKRSKAIRPLLNGFKYRYGLTGTPITKNYISLFGQFLIIDKTIFGTSITAYRETFFNQIRRGYGSRIYFDYEIKKGAADYINKTFAPYCIRLDKSLNSDIPDIVYNDIKIRLPEDIQKQYKKLEKELYIESENEGTILIDDKSTGYIRCHQYVNGAIYTDTKHNIKYIHQEKIKALKELIDSLQGKGLLIAYWYKSDIYLLQKYIKGISFLGGKNDEKIIDKWNKQKIDIIAGHPMSIGQGLNLQGGGFHIVWFSQCNRPALYDQFNARLARTGQENKNVFIHNIICMNTIDIAIRQSNKTKENFQKYFFDYLKKEQEK